MIDLPLPAGLELPEPMRQALVAAYQSPGRAYHDLAHVREVVRWFHETARAIAWDHPREVFVALLFHDAIYRPGAADNEEQSAHLAREIVGKWLSGSTIDLDRVERLIRLTARHGTLVPDEVDLETARFLDCDMAILGSAPDAYDRYEAGIASEYSAIPPELFREGRRRFLERLITAPRIFLSDHFHALLDGAARANLRRAVERLGGAR
jgi:predicted metal-dependent HD superfamily phosphohydrolase